MHRIKLIIVLFSLVVIIVARISILYLSLKIKARLLRWRYRRGFSKTLRKKGVPPHLAETLVERYDQYMKSALSIPGPLDIFRYSYKYGRHWESRPESLEEK